MTPETCHFTRHHWWHVGFYWMIGHHTGGSFEHFFPTCMLTKSTMLMLNCDSTRGFTVIRHKPRSSPIPCLQSFPISRCTFNNHQHGTWCCIKWVKHVTYELMQTMHNCSVLPLSWIFCSSAFIVFGKKCKQKFTFVWILGRQHISVNSVTFLLLIPRPLFLW